MLLFFTSPKLNPPLVAAVDVRSMPANLSFVIVAAGVPFSYLPSRYVLGWVSVIVYVPGVNVSNL